MTANQEIEAKLAKEVEDAVAKIMGLIAEMNIQQKLGVLYQLDCLISMEQAANHERH